MLFSVMSLNAQSSSESFNHKGLAFTQKEQTNSLSTLQQLSEKEETETESDIDLDLVSFELPFLNAEVVFISFESARVADLVSLQIASQPVYILTSTFRI